MRSHDCILVIDSNKKSRTSTENNLKKLNYQVYGLSNGYDTIDSIIKIKPDCILIEIDIEGIDGIEIIRRIKEIEDFINTPIIVFSRLEELNYIEDSIDAGAIDYIKKPSKLLIINSRIRSALRTYRVIQEKSELTKDLLLQKQELSVFTHMVSHDLKSPIVGAASLFDLFLFKLKENFPDIYKDKNMIDILNRIPLTFTKMLNFINTLLDYAESGRVIGELKLIPMDQIVDAVIQNFDFARKKGIVSFKRVSKLPSVMCDPIRMLQVWQNLISNSIKYRGSKNPVLVKLGGISNKDLCTFWLEDNGPGIPKDSQKKIFQPFYRADINTEGNGIGLATTEKLIKAHGGFIKLDVSITNGAKFIFELPQLQKNLF